MGKIIVIVVAVVATIWTAGASLGYLTAATPGATLTTAAGTTALSGASAWTAGMGLVTGSVGGVGFGTLAAAGAVGGAVGSIAGQMAGIGLGVQDSFSWKGVLQGALQGGVAAGLGSWLQGSSSVLAGKDPLMVASRMAVSNAAGQGLGIAAGLQQRFDWKGVAASAAAGYVSAWVGQSLPRALNDSGRGLATSLASGFVSSAVRGGSLSQALPGILADAIGATVGNMLGESLAGAMGQGATSANDTEIYRQQRIAQMQAQGGFASASAYAPTRADGTPVLPVEVQSPQVFSGFSEALGLPVSQGRAASTPLPPFPDRWVPSEWVGGDYGYRVPGYWTPIGGAATGGYAATTNASVLGITDAQVDADIAAGKTGVLDALSYAGRKTAYSVWNFATAGFVERYDNRLTAAASGRLSDDNLIRATVIDAAASVGSLALGGRAGSYVLGKLGSGYLGSAASGAAFGAAFDATQQAGQNAIYQATDGQTGTNGVSLKQFAVATGGGAILGVVGRAAGGATEWVGEVRSAVNAAEGWSVAQVERTALLAERGSANVSNATSNFSGSVVVRDGSMSRDVSWFDQQAVLGNMATSDIGRQVLIAAKSNQFRLEFSKSYYQQGPNGAVDTGVQGYAFPTKAKVYLPAHTSNEAVARTAIHEGIHELGVVGSQRAEALARLAELQHQGIPIKFSTMRGVLGDIRSAVHVDGSPVYTGMPWKLGEQSTAFPGVIF
ncbi:hypothetical protein ACFJIS_21270 [Variovorax boronicumulans]|uniref:hypothetical protein n=1 Tax=Variovorax boronicumulans TaxID=436515 RepID=UPI0036F25491